MESQRLQNGLKDFGAGFIRIAQTAGVLKPMDPMLLMELIFSAFNGMMRAHWEGRIHLDETSLAEAEAACWDACAVH